MRWSQKRGVRKRAAADARRYAKYLRERDVELAEAGELQRGRAAAAVPGREEAVDAAGQARATSGSAARTTATSCTCALGEGTVAARPRRSSSTSG